MFKVWQFAWGATKKWWALMSCAAFTLTAFWAALWNKDNHWLVWATGVLAVAFLLIAFYQLWSEQHERALRAEALIRKPPVSSVEWEALAPRFRALTRVEVWINEERHHVTWRTTNEEFRALCKKAGLMLLKSPNVRASLDEAILSQSEPVDRWLNAMRAQSGYPPSDLFQLRVVGSSDIVSCSAPVRALGKYCADFCLDCAAEET